MNRHVLLGTLLLILPLSFSTTASAAQQKVTILVLSTYAGEVGVTSGLGADYKTTDVPCGAPVPADSNPLPRDPGAATPFCPPVVGSFPTSTAAHFTRTNATLTTESGTKYPVLLYCQRQLSDCPKLSEGAAYAGLMDKKAVLAISKTFFKPVKVVLRPDGRHKVSYTIFPLGR